MRIYVSIYKKHGGEQTLRGRVQIASAEAEKSCRTDMEGYLFYQMQAHQPPILPPKLGLRFEEFAHTLLNATFYRGQLQGERARTRVATLLADPTARFGGHFQQAASDLYVTCQVFAEGAAMCLPTQTSSKPLADRRTWDEWLTLPVKYRDLPRSACVAFTVYDIGGPRRHVPCGGTTIPLFGSDGTLQTGPFTLRVWQDVAGDGLGQTTPGRADTELERLQELLKLHKQGDLHHVDWLDSMALKTVEARMQVGLSLLHQSGRGHKV